MAFSQTAIQDVTATPQGVDTLVAWMSTAAAGTIYQVYVNLVLVWHGTATSVVLALAATSRIDVGTVAAGEGTVDFSSSLATLSGAREKVELQWDGGSWEKTTLDVSGFHVYGADAAGGSVDYTKIIATISLSVQGIPVTGWGMGGWGVGGWGGSGASYAWTSGYLCPGSWTFGVRPFDIAGNEGTAVEATAVVAGAPNPPAPNAKGQRLTYSNFHLSMGSAYATLNWLAPPAC